MRLKSRSAKTIVLSAGKAIASVGSLAIAIVLSRNCSKFDYATYKQTFLAFKMATPILGLGLGQALFYFMPTQQDRNRGLILENLMLLFMMGVIYWCFMTFGGQHLLAELWNNPWLSATLFMMAPIAIYHLPINSVGPCMISQERVEIAAVFAAFGRVTIVLVTIIAFLVARTIESAMIAYLAGTLMVGSLAVFLMLGFSRHGKPKFGSAMGQIAYGFPLGIGTMVGAISKNVDRTMVSMYCPTEQYAVFENGAFELPLIAIVTGSMASILLVDYRKMLAEDRKGEILPLLHKAAIKSGTILIPAMIFLICVAPEFLVCLFGSEYRESAVVFRVYLLLLPVRCLVFGSIGLAAGKTKLLALVPVVTLLVNIVLNYFAISFFGSVGAAIATVVCIYLVSATGRLIIARKVLECRALEFIPWSDFARLFLASSVAVPFLYLASRCFPGSQPVWLRLLAATFIYSTITFPILVTMGFFESRDVWRKIGTKFFG